MTIIWGHHLVPVTSLRSQATLEDLDDVLKVDLGFQSMFDVNEGDFSGIPSGKKYPDLFVSSVIQKAFIELNEDGTEAAAASSCVVTAKGCSRTKPITIPFVVDHPFYFQIVDNENGELVLFSGHVNDPSCSEIKMAPNHNMPKSVTILLLDNIHI